MGEDIPSPAEMADELRKQWWRTLVELLEALSETFPECSTTMMLVSIV